ncbi:ABC transporter ATP-binding protein [Streptomyces sp. NPDC055400]
MSAATSNALLECRGITVRFGGLLALDDVSVRVPPGSVTGLIGPNGAGKTTLFGVLSGLVPGASGHVHLGGRDVSRATPQQRARLGLGRTFQRPEVFATTTVRDHLSLGWRTRHQRSRVLKDLIPPLGLRAARAEVERIALLLDVLGLAQAADRPAGILPLGLLRRLEVGRALANEPRVLLLDEPASGLDPSETAELAEVLRRAVDTEGIALLLVEHDLPFVLGLSEQVYVLDFGKVIAHGTPAEISESAAVRAAYLGFGEV